MLLSVRGLAQAERREFAELLTELSDHEWETPSLCAGWTVRDVVAHVLSYEDLTARAVVGRMARARLSLSGTNDASLDDYRDWEPAQLINRMRRCVDPHGLTTGFGCRVALLDAMAHQQDIRRPLGRPRIIPSARIVPALNFARIAPPIGAYRRILGLRFAATDIAWAAGRGAQVSGPAEAILMVTAGRAAALDDLSGPGVQKLRDRLDRPPGGATRL